MTTKRRKTAGFEEDVAIFEALLDHLGRLLAEEYVTLLSSDPQPTETPKEDEP